MLQKKSWLLFIISIGQVATGLGQSDPFAQLKSLPVQTPQSASLIKSVEYPVSYFNGRPQISIPLYNINSGDISLPITLSYHSGGIKATEEAGWAGLGFAVDAGGLVSHEIKGNDDLGQHTFNEYFPNSEGNTYHINDMDQVMDHPGLLLGIDGNPVDQNQLYLKLAQGSSVTEAEPDLYIYNFGSYSGKFMWLNGQLVDLNHNNINFIQGGTSITAVTPDGFTYIFNKTEKSFGGTYSPITAFYLTQITSSKGKTISFQYKSFYELYTANSWQSQYEGNPFTSGDYVAQMPTLFQTVGAMEFVSGIRSASGQEPISPQVVNSFNTPYNQVVYLDRITFDNGYVQFVQGPRQDLYGAKLEQIQVYRSDNSLVKKILFNYDYFVGSSDDGLFNPNIPYTGYRLPYPVSYRAKRLKLTGIQVDDQNYAFAYNEGSNGYTLPLKSTFSQDYWGYYNGKNTNNTLVPDFRRYSQNTTLTPLLKGYVGADKEQDEARTKEGTLQQITFPTGGTTQFGYELNSYGNIGAEQSVVYKPVSLTVADIGTGTQQQYFTLTEDTYLTINGALFCNNGPDLAAPNDCNCFVGSDCYTSGGITNGLYAFIMQVDPVTHAAVNGGYLSQWDKNTPIVHTTGGNFIVNNELLPAGTYVMTVNYPDNKAPGIMGQKMAFLSINYFTVDNSSPPPTEKQCGGLRIKTITDFDPVANTTKTRNFTYSGGVLMHYPIFYHRRTENFEVMNRVSMGGGFAVSFDESVWYFHYLYNNPVFPYSFSANGSIAGYAKVTETVLDGGNGKTEYYYKVAPDKFINMNLNDEPGVPTTPYLDNGFLQKTIVYDKNNTVLKQIDNIQEILLTKTYWPFKYSTHFSQVVITDGTASSIATPNSSDAFAYYTYFSFYPIQVGKLMTQGSAVSDYSNGQSLITTKTFQYNDNGLLKQVNTVSSDGHQLATNYTYAPDYTGVTSGWQKDMRDKNMVGLPLEMLTTRDNLVTGGSYTTYRTHDNIITPNQVYRMNITAPQSIGSTAPSGIMPTQFELEGTVDYDANGNLQYAQAANDIYTSYIWGYNNTLPVATATGALPKDIFYTSFEDGDGNSADFDSKAGKKSKIDGFQKILSNLTPGDYELTYWLKSSGAWTLQSNVVTVVAGGYTINLSGQVDEVRFYPKSAQMTTFTFDPLVGITSQNDPTNRINYYEYDVYARLMHIRDLDNNILKKYDYNYQTPVSSIPSWRPDGNSRCKPCAQNPVYSVNVSQIEIKDYNPYSTTYNQTRWVDQGASASCGSPADWQNTSTPVRCKTVAGINTSEQEQEQADMNPCSSTYNQTQWVVIATNCASCPTPANWQNVNTYRCVKDAGNNNTGAQEQQQTDVNSCSSTYNQNRWISVGTNTTACPLPCNSTTCSGTNHHCVNGVCQTGTLIVMSRQYAAPVCVTAYGYFFTDGTVQYDHTSTTYGPCN